MKNYRMMVSMIVTTTTMVMMFSLVGRQVNAFAPPQPVPTSRSYLLSSSSDVQLTSGNSGGRNMIGHDEHQGTIISPSRRDMLCRSVSTVGLAVGVAFRIFPTGVASAAAPAGAEKSKALSEEYRQGTAALADMNEETAPVPREAYKKLPSGVIIADLRPGKSTEIVKVGSRVNLQWVLRKSNGYFVDSSQTNDSVPFIFTVGDGTAIAGVDEGIRGMGVGGVRRLLIPPSLAYVQGLEDGKPGPLPVGFGPRQQMRRVQNVRKDVPGEYIYLEVQVTKIR